MKKFTWLNIEAVRKRTQEITSHIFAIIGVTVSVITLILMATSKSSRLWVGNHPYLIFWILLAAIVVILVLLNFMQSINNKYRTIRSLHSPGNPQGTDHDKKLICEFLTYIPPKGDLVRGLKSEFSPVSISLDLIQALAEATRRLNLDSIYFDDKAVAAGYLELSAAAERFNQTIQRWTSLEAGNTQRIIPIEWEFAEHGKYQLARIEIQYSRDDLIRTYDSFLHICHDHGLNAS